MDDVVVDTNVWISGILLGGTASTVLQRIEERNGRICISPKIIEEIDRVLAYRKIQRVLTRVGRTRSDVLKQIIPMCRLVRPEKHISVVKDDPSDDMFLECAVQCRASCIISGDKHLLHLESFKGIQILSPSRFLRAHP